MSTLISHLYESLLDDEDILVDDDKWVVRDFKNKIIEFIKSHYILLNRSHKQVNIEKYLKINNDFSVDIKKSKSSFQRYTLQLKDWRDPLGPLPTENFTWGNVQDLYLECSELKKLPEMPTTISCLYLDNCKIIQNIDLSNVDIMKSIRINHGNDLQNIKLNPNHILEDFSAYYMPKLKSITGFPSLISNSLVLYDCPNLNKLSYTSALSLTCYNCTSLSENELNKINSQIKHIS